MKKLKKIMIPLLPVLLLLTFLAGYSSAALLDVGPKVPEVDASSPPQHGYPLWYRDNNRLPLEICLSTAPSPNAVGSNMCNLLPGPTLDPTQALVFPSNFPDEAFWWSADAKIDNGIIRGSVILALEGAWNTGEIASGQQITFARMRIVVDTPVPGTYRIVFPYGERTFANVPAGVHAIFHTEDIGIEVGKFDGALQGGIGPFLRWDSGIPINVNGELFIGDPNVEHTVTGSPTGNNFFRIEGPAGSDLDGLGNRNVQTNLFMVTGKIHQDAIPTPLTVDKAVYARDPGVAQVNVFATSGTVANETNSFAPFPGNFALAGTPTALRTSGAGIPTVDMQTNNPVDGKYFSATGLFSDSGLPATLTVTNTADVPPTVVQVPLVDEVTAQATYRPIYKTLVINAASSDRVTPPALQAFMPGMTAPLGDLSAGELVVYFPVTDSSTVPAGVFENPPLTLTVKSALGGEVTVPVRVKDEVDPPPTGSIVINGDAALTNSASVTLTLTATDNSGVVAQMQFSKDGIAWFPWEPYLGTRTATLAPIPGDGVKTIYVRFKDGAGNVSLVYSDSITYDATAPTGTIVINDGDAYTKTGTVTLTLSSSDPNGVTQMQFSKNGGLTWFPWEPVAATRRVSLPNVPGADGVRELHVRYKDAAGNVSAAIGDSIIYDLTAPTGTIAIEGGAGYTKSATVNLTLTATDANVVSQMQFSKDGGVTWFAWEPFSTTRRVTLPNIPGADGVRELHVRYKDGAGNISAAVSDTIVYDTVAPTGSIVISGGAATTKVGTATLTLAAADLNGVTEMAFSKDAGVTWLAWEPFATSKRISLPNMPGPDGERALHVRYRDAAGNISAVANDTIIYDTTAPTGTIQINGGAATTNSNAVSLALSANDLNGVTHMQFSKDGGVTWLSWVAYANTSNVTLVPAGPGPKTWDVRYRDGAGNISAKAQATITVQ